MSIKEQESKKDLTLVLLFSLVIGFFGFFIYPKISYQRDVEVPGVIRDLQATIVGIGQNNVRLNWTEIAEATSYIARYVADRDKVEVSVPSNRGPGNPLSYTFNGLDYGKTYTMSVAGVSSAGTGPFAEVYVEIPALAPAAPTNLTATPENTSVTLNWKESVTYGAEVDSYMVGYRIDPKAGFTFEESKGDSTEYTLKQLVNGTEYEFAVYATSSAGNSATSSSVFATPGGATSTEPDPEGISITSGPNVSVSSNSATITWSTDISGTSIVSYGPTNSLGYSSSGSNARNHSLTISNLLPCTIYAYKVSSTSTSKEDPGTAESQIYDFVTDGCKGGANVIARDKDLVTPASSARVEIVNSGRGLKADAPSDLVTGKEVAIQAIKVSRDEIVSQIAAPPSRTWVGNPYVLNVIDGLEYYSGEFDKPVSVSIGYTNEEVAGIDVNTLKIWHHSDSTGWRELSSCSVDANGGGGTVTCSTNSFSVFGIFGQQSGGGTPGPAAQGGSSVVIGSQVAQNNQATPTAPTTPSVNNVTSPSNNNGYNFEKDLWYGVNDPDVTKLQKFLNLMGFTVSTSGYGSAGQETDYFGPKTKEALIKFQEANKSQILTPIGLNLGTGFFGIQTRTFINAIKN